MFLPYPDHTGYQGQIPLTARKEAMAQWVVAHGARGLFNIIGEFQGTSFDLPALTLLQNMFWIRKELCRTLFLSKTIDVQLINFFPSVHAWNPFTAQEKAEYRNVRTPALPIQLCT